MIFCFAWRNSEQNHHFVGVDIDFQDLERLKRGGEVNGRLPNERSETYQTRKMNREPSCDEEIVSVMLADEQNEDRQKESLEFMQ